MIVKQVYESEYIGVEGWNAFARYHIWSSIKGHRQPPSVLFMPATVSRDLNKKIVVTRHDYQKT